MSPDVSIIIPTFRRPGGLSKAAYSVIGQANPCGLSLELLIVDNDPAGSARERSQAIAADAPFPVHYVHMPEPGVANARNAGVAASSAPLIAFLDDDEEAPRTWLCELVGAQRFHGADAVFGPVRARVPEDVRAHRDYYAEFFSRFGPEESGPIADYYGCGNSLVRRAALPNAEAPFAVERNAIGGEDDLLFGQMKAAHARFVWCEEAWVWEDPSLSRASLKYTLRRAFAYGQGPSAACASSRPANPLGVVFWMLVGAAQFAIYGIAALALWLVRAPRRARMLDKAMRGLGKVFWGGPFSQQFYGIHSTN
ncbi:glycosyltransferase family 2 protein [Hyphobacterium marinum]|uniref:Glycosyltransferase family 2 protein n=1 Tax=Hyphobacterium marinum TaxID=3116574 RepID=A0ABU7LUN7_9PROT|nr:glycosyltransferase family 2 protein [Hyphobacterium sp. Y6023]MEE2565254.1 glycosyltransferase family 2 protein [Hyphobacterium sp. Y6023]